MANDELTAQAERALRRGDMAEAIRIYGDVVAADPADAHAAARLAELKELLQPMELMNPKARAPTVPAQLSPEQEGERLFNQGDYAGAARAYREALRAKPDSALIQERLVELIRLAQAQAPSAPAAVGAAPSAPPAGAAPAAKPSAPPTPETALEELLARIARRRRG